MQSHNSQHVAINSSEELDLALFLAFHRGFPRKISLPPHPGWARCINPGMGTSRMEGPELCAGERVLPSAFSEPFRIMPLDFSPEIPTSQRNNQASALIWFMIKCLGTHQEPS